MIMGDPKFWDIPRPRCRQGLFSTAQTMGDPKFWDMDCHGKLCFLIGYMQSEMPAHAVEYPNVALATNSELVDSLIRMEARKKGQMKPQEAR